MLYFFSELVAKLSVHYFFLINSVLKRQSIINARNDSESIDLFL